MIRIHLVLQGGLLMSGHAIHIKVDGRTYSGTYAVDRKNLTVTTSYAKKTAEVSPKISIRRWLISSWRRW